MPHFMSYDEEARYEAAVRRRIRQNAQKTQPMKLAAFREEHEAVFQFLQERLPNGGFGELLLSFRTQLDDFGRLSPKQIAVVEKAIARRNEWQAQAAQKREVQAQTSNWVGEIKERRMWDVKVVGSTAVEGYNGVYHINTCEDDQGNVIVYKGNRWEKGTRVLVKATVKAHDVYRGVKQTVINRPR